MSSFPSTKPATVRLSQGAALLVGAVAEYVVAGLVLGFDWTPLVLGLSYLVAALLGGRRGGHWPTALVLSGVGVAVLAQSRWGLDVPAAPLYVVGAGVGALAAGLLDRAGLEADALGVAGTITAFGLAFLLAGVVGPPFNQAYLYALLLAAVGLVNLAGAAWGRRDGGGESEPAES